MTMPHDPGPLSVHIENVSDLKTALTEEVEPEHFTCQTFTVQLGQPGQVSSTEETGIAQVLALDPMRKDASILSVDSPIVVCHTYRQAQDAANAVALTPFPQGAYLPAGGSVTLTGTGPLWVAATVATVSRVSVVQNRRGGL